MHSFLQSLFICLFLKWITSNGSSLPKDLNTLKIGDNYALLLGKLILLSQSEIVVLVQNCLRISNDFLFYISEFLSVLYDIT